MHRMRAGADAELGDAQRRRDAAGAGRFDGVDACVEINQCVGCTR